MHDSDNVYDLIQKLRPQWLRGRGSKSSRYWQASYPVVYVVYENGSRYGDIYSLSTMSTHKIK
ncbi:hypothetical protein MJD09_15325, partial [bacterium]|nr:hypothetical protein [bacterium]